jgi:Uma2 family endonuclease
MNTAEPDIELSDYEKERGKPMPGLNHSVIQLRLGASFLAQAGDQYLIASELTLEFADAPNLTPDLSILPNQSLDWGHEQVRYRQTPIMVVEIPSASQGYQIIMDKLDVYFAHGIQSAWVVHTHLRAIAIHRPDFPAPELYQQGEIKDPITGLTARVEEIFRPSGGFIVKS